jgi:hypothetical protein
MAEAATRSPVPGQRVLIACLAVLLGILMANEVCDPIVRTFGLAHAKVVAGEHGRILVLDSLPSADAPSVQTVFQGEIWGRHSYKVHQVLLPFLMLTMAMAGLAHLLARHVSGVGWRFFHLQRGSALPPVSLWVALFMGGCLAAWSVEGPNFHSSFALIPFVLSLSLGAVISVSPQPNASVLARVFWRFPRRDFFAMKVWPKAPALTAGRRPACWHAGWRCWLCIWPPEPPAVWT